MQHREVPGKRQWQPAGRRGKGLTFAEVLLEVEDAAVLPQLLPVPPELHRGQHFYTKPVAGCLSLLRVCLRIEEKAQLRSELLIFL